MDNGSIIYQENKRHREVIRKCLPQALENATSTTTNISTASTTTVVAVDDGWEMLILQGIRLDCKLQPKIYIRELTTSILAHQVIRMIECHFQFYYQGEKDDTTCEMLHTTAARSR